MSRHDIPLNAAEKLNHALLMQWVKGAWECNDNVAVEDHFHPECVVTGMAPEILEGVAQVRAAHNALCGRINHRNCNVPFLLIRGDEFSGFVEIEGTHNDTGIDIAFEVSISGRLRDGLIYRSHSIVDYTGLYAKLGVLDVEKLREVMG